MALSSRPRAPAQLAKLWSTMAMGEVPDASAGGEPLNLRDAPRAPKRGLLARRQNAHVR